MFFQPLKAQVALNLNFGRIYMEADIQGFLLLVFVCCFVFCLFSAFHILFYSFGEG